MPPSSRGRHLVVCISALCCLTAVTALRLPQDITDTRTALSDYSEQQQSEPLGTAHPASRLEQSQHSTGLATPAFSGTTARRRLVNLWHRQGAELSRLSRGGHALGNLRARFYPQTAQRRRLQQEVVLHSKGKGDNSWRKDPDVAEAQRRKDEAAAAASHSDKVHAPFHTDLLLPTLSLI